MAGSSGFRVGTIALLAAVAVALGVALLSESPSDAAGGYRPPKANQSEMVLRRPDLPPGFGNGYLGEGRGDDGLLCEAFSDPSAQHGAMVEFVRKYRPSGCIAAYDKLYEIPGEPPFAPVVFSGVLALGNATAATDAWHLIPTMLGRVLLAGQPRQVETALKVGARSRLFHTPRAWFPYLIRGKHKASLLAWRSGNTIAVVVAMGGSVATNDRVVAELAPRQQAHILEPTPYTAAERSDAEVGLDNPAIDLPVYWLGRNFRPGHGLPPNRLFRSYFSGEPLPETNEDISEKPYGPLGVAYENIWLDTWTPATWSVFADSRVGRAITSWKCTRTRTIPLSEGTATIFAGYKEDFRQCPDEKRKVFTAWVDLGEVRIVVNSPPAWDFIETVNPYGSFEGMEAIVRSLRLRPKPTS
ncbi:MAG TPA: hypothetical protein VNC16_01470 [Solirubrobacterales bacterium]|jgi:hypothetical protein|nr:hypothetical protein [Solirubrobacterales bacterium]